jgi:ankyrin repeat protein
MSQPNSEVDQVSMPGRVEPAIAGNNRISLLKKAIGFLLACALFLAAWRFLAPWPLAKSTTATPAARDDHRLELTDPLMVAIRAGDAASMQSLLEAGADANARDENGDTALMRAALYADGDSMTLLLARGADTGGRGTDGATPLVRAAHDLEKMRLLLDRGAKVDSLAMIAAARVPGARPRLELLLAHGGMGQAQVNGYTALMAAAGNGDLPAVTCLLDHGALAAARTTNGYTALYGAAVAGNPEVVRVLLERGADPNVVCELVNTEGDIQTPAILAASMGHTECLRRLIARGADVNVQGGPFERTALLAAATTGDEESIRILLAKGANAAATDWEGDSALDWAKRSGETGIVKTLREAHVTESAPTRRPNQPARPHQQVDGRSVERAVAASLPLLQRSGQHLTQKNHCVTCHQHALLAMTVGLARDHGFAVDEGIAGQERAHVLEHVTQRTRTALMGNGIETTLAPYILAGLAAENVPQIRQTDALVHYLVIRQREDGRWQTENFRPPEDASDFMVTALAVRGLAHYAPKGRSAEISRRIASARTWLEHAQPSGTVERAFHLLGLGWVHAAPGARKRAADSLEAAQRPDGGWAQLPTLSSDAYATGVALFALHEGGGVPCESPAYRRGVEFLLGSQLTDGSWFVASRCFPFVGYTSSGFPHGKSQFISAAATCWATMALAVTVPPVGGRATASSRASIPPALDGYENPQRQ